MRATLLVITIIVSGCATAVPSFRVTQPIGGPCLVEKDMTDGPRAHRLNETLYLEGRRVPGDDLVAATERDERANALAARATRHQRLGVGGILLGAALAAPGAGLIGFGDDHHQDAALGFGAALTAAGAGALLAGMILAGRSAEERQEAVLAYNADVPPSCH